MMLLLLPILLISVAQDEAAFDAQVKSYALALRTDATRDRAWDRLAHMGKPALSILEKLEIEPSHLRSIREEILLHDRIRDSYGAPRTFTFDGSEDSLGGYLSRLETGMENGFQKYSLDLSQRVSVRAADASFWEALDAICRQSTVTYYTHSADPIYLNPGTPAPKPRGYHGPLMILIDRLVQQRRINFDKTSTEFTIHLLCVWERHVMPLGLNRKYTLVRAMDDTGKSLLPARFDSAVPRRPISLRTGAEPLEIAGLQCPAAAAKKLAVLEGTLELAFPERAETVKFPAPGEQAPVVKELEGAAVELKSCLPAASGGVTAEFSIHFRDEKEAAAFRISPRDLEFVSSEDRKAYLTINSAQADKGDFSFTVRCRNITNTKQLTEIRFRVPRGVVIKNVPFLFKDVDLK